MQPSSLPREYSVHKAWWQFCLASYSGDCSQPTARNLQSNVETIRPRRRWEHPQKFGLNSNHAFWNLQRCQLERRNFLQKCDFSAEGTVHEQNGESINVRPFGKSIGRFRRVHFLSRKKLSKKIADSCCPASLAQITSLCFEESILVFMGVRAFCSKYDTVETQIFSPWLQGLVTLSQSEGPYLGNPSVSSKKYVFCSETSTTQNLESQVALIQY